MKAKSAFLALSLACAGILVSTGRTTAADEPAKVAGTWEISIEAPQGTFSSTLVLQQEGSTIKGTLTSPRGDGPVEGSVTGNNIKFSTTRETPNGTFTIEYTGTVDGASMKGTLHAGGFDADWTAKRTAEAEKK